MEVKEWLAVVASTPATIKGEKVPPPWRPQASGACATKNLCAVSPKKKAQEGRIASDTLFTVHHRPGQILLVATALQHHAPDM